jgi:hypothetical protein
MCPFHDAKMKNKDVVYLHSKEENREAMFIYATVSLCILGSISKIFDLIAFNCPNYQNYNTRKYWNTIKY